MDNSSITFASTSTLTPANAAEFTLFRFLPAELRLKIYDTFLSLPSGTPTNHQTRRILKISYSPSLSRYISATPPPVLLHLSHEARAYTQSYYTSLLLGANAKSPSFPTSIPISFSTDTLYLSSLHPLLATHLHDILFHLSTSPSRHLIQSLAIDLRCWSELCENGFLGVLARMRGLKEVLLVVEFGRVGNFRGELGWLQVPGWRGDLFWVSERAEEKVREERSRARGRDKWKGKGGVENKDEIDKVSVNCVLLTRGGEQA
ncbi:hypothetical protein EG329_013206 [Mollisiaceae sp. DMI_Dod_QoI]|nr:hypothetical protein EG329_013206 [Helotiales sp. DMI_Dod_QoI]